MHLYGSAKMMDEHSRISIQPHSMKIKKKKVFVFDDDIKDCKITFNENSNIEFRPIKSPPWVLFMFYEI